MKTWQERGRAAAKPLILLLTIGVALLAKEAAAANDKIPMQSAAGIFFAQIFDHLPSTPFELPKEMVIKDSIVALNLGGLAQIPITDITHVAFVANGVVINGQGGTRAVRADTAVGVAVDDRDVFSIVAAPKLAEYAQGTGAAVNLVLKSVPIGSDLFAPEQNRDFRPVYSRSSNNAVWGLNPGFNLPSRIAYTTESSFFKVKDAGDAVPNRTVPPPGGTGTTFDFFDSNYDINSKYVLFKGNGAFFNGAYTYRQSDQVTFAAAESFILASDNFGQINGVFLHGDRDVFFDAEGGLYKADAEGATAPELVLPDSGFLHHVAGDYGALVNNIGGSAIIRVNLLDYSVETVVQKGDVAPGGEVFEIVQRPGLSDELVVFEAFDPALKFLGLYGRSLDTWEITPFVRVGDTFDGREVRTVSFQPGAVHGMTVGATVYFTDDSSGAYLLTTDDPFKVPFGQISTRLFVGTGDNAGIGGFVNVLLPNGPNEAARPHSVGAKRVLIRAIGPSLGAFGIEGPLADPLLEVHLPDDSVLTNDNWRDTQEQEIIDSGLAPTDDAESAIIATIEPGNATAIVNGVGGGTGVGLVEIYDLDGPGVSELGNISTRGLVQSGENVMIGGIIVNGSDCTASTMVVRAIGPSLADFGVNDPLLDPLLEVRDLAGNLIASNDNWKDTQESELVASGLAPGDEREAALQVALATGLYTAIVRGSGETSGIALVEAYNLETATFAARPAMR